MYEFYKKFFLLNLKDYQNINIDFPITVLLFALSLAFVAVIIIVNFRRNRIELLIRQLKRRDAVSEESALTLSEIKLDNFVFRKMLSSEGQLTKLVGRAGEKKYTYEEYIALTKGKNNMESIDFRKARFYLRNESDERTKHILEGSSPTVLNTVLLCVLVLASFVCISFIMPGILNIINNLLEPK